MPITLNRVKLSVKTSRFSLFFGMNSFSVYALISDTSGLLL